MAWQYFFCFNTVHVSIGKSRLFPFAWKAGGLGLFNSFCILLCKYIIAAEQFLCMRIAYMIQNGLKNIFQVLILCTNINEQCPLEACCQFNIFTIISTQMLFHQNPFRGKKLVIFPWRTSENVIVEITFWSWNAV